MAHHREHHSIDKPACFSKNSIFDKPVAPVVPWSGEYSVPACKKQRALQEHHDRFSSALCVASHTSKHAFHGTLALRETAPDARTPDMRVTSCSAEPVGVGEHSRVYVGQARLASGELIRVALKRVRDAPDSVQAARGEAFLGSCLRHPRLIGYHGILACEAGAAGALVCSTGSAPRALDHLVFDYAACGSLWDVLKSGSHVLDYTRCVRFLVDLSDALCYVHSHGVIHHDVKPHNILVFREGPDALTLRLSDFGAARVVDPNAGAPSVQSARGRGTLSYLAPELVDPKRSTYTSGIDVYSAAASLHTVAFLKGRNPFSSIRYAPILMATLCKGFLASPDNLPNPLVFNDSTLGCPKFVALLKSCLHVDPENRPTSAQLWESAKSLASAHPACSCC